MRYEVEIEGQRRVVEIRQVPGGGYALSVDGAPVRTIQVGALGPSEWRLTEDGVTRAVSAAVAGDRVDVQVADHALVATVIDPRDRVTLADGAAEGVVATPMPGLVSRILVQEGQDVDAGQVLLVVEAMKMENEFKSRIAGRVAQIHVTAGVAVDAGALLVTVTP